MAYWLNNFNEENKADVLWENINIVFDNKNVVNRDGSSMVEHLNAFQGLINQTTSLEVPLAYELLALMLLGSLPNSWEALIVTLGNDNL